MGFIPTLNSFIAGTPIVASEVNANFASIVAVVNGGINHENIVNGGITSELIAAGAVTETKLGDNSVTNAKLSDDAVTGRVLAADVVDNFHLVDGSVTANKLAATAVTTGKIADGAITTPLLQDEAVVPPKVQRLKHRIITSNDTAVLADMDGSVFANSSSTVQFTLPPFSEVPFPVGSIIELLALGTGRTFIRGGTGVTLRSPAGQSGQREIFGQYSSAFARNIAEDEWVIQGLLV